MRGLLKRIDRYQRGHPWLAVPIAVAKKFGEDKAGQLAVLVAYYGFFSLFPLLLALVTIAGLVFEGNTGLQERIVGSALAQFPVLGDRIRENVGRLGAAAWRWRWAWEGRCGPGSGGSRRPRTPWTTCGTSRSSDSRASWWPSCEPS